jgi:hypothetical protein
VLDPRISYEGLKIDYANEPMLSELLEQAKSNLFDYFRDNYVHTVAVSSTPPSVDSVPSPSVRTSPTTGMGSPQKSFTARYRRKEKAESINELEEYFKLPTEDFDACDPILWWMGRRAVFPILFHLARDILCIPGALFSRSLHEF